MKRSLAWVNVNQMYLHVDDPPSGVQRHPFTRKKD
jgi:hypothetical protein